MGWRDPSEVGRLPEGVAWTLAVFKHPPDVLYHASRRAPSHPGPKVNLSEHPTVL